MTASVLQEFNSSPAGSAANVTCAETALTSGSSRHVVAISNLSVTHTGVTDLAGNTYTKRDDITGAGGLRMTSWTAVNCNNHGGSDTVTCAFSGSQGQRGIYVAEIGGVSAAGFDGHIAADQATPGTGANGVTTGSGAGSTNANQPALINAFSLLVFYNATLAAGTGFTAGFGIGTWGSGQPGGVQAENKRITATGAQAATFTASIANESMACMVIFDEAVAAALAGTPSDVTAASAALTTAFNLAAAAASSTTGSATLTNWASVTLSGTQYSGVGGLLDPNLVWPNRAPQVGDVIYYDATFLTIAADGEFVATTNAFTAIVQFNDGTQWNVVALTFSPGFVSYAQSTSAATGALTTAIQIAAAATALTTASASLTGFRSIAGAASSVSAATGALVAQIRLVAAAIDASIGTGAMSTLIQMLGAASGSSVGTGSLSINSGGAPLVGSPADISSATAALTSLIQLAAAAVEVTTAAGALVTQIKLTGASIDASIATGSLNTNPLFASSAVSASSAAAALTTVITITGSATELSAASAALTTQVLMLASAADFASASGALMTGDPILGAAASLSSASASLTIAALMGSTALSQSQASGVLSSGINMIAAAISNDAAYGALTAAGAGVFSDAVIVYAPAKNAQGVGQIVFGIFNQRIGELIAYGINWDAWLAAMWASGQPTTVGETVRPTTHIGYQARCSTAGVTGDTEPSWPAYIGGQIVDASAVWTMTPLDSTSLVASITGVEWVADPGLAVGFEGVSGEITLAVVDSTNAQADTDYNVVCTAQLSDAEQKTGQLRIAVQ